MSSYIGNQPSGQGQAERFIFTCTGTTPTITHDNDGLPISYVVNHVSVYLNGVKQVVGTDVTCTNGSSVVFASDLVVSDVVEVIALSTFAAATTEGTSIQSTGETGNVKFLGEDGDNSSSWKQVDSGSIATGAIDLAHMSVNSIDSDQYVDASIDSAHIGNDQIDSQHYAAGSIDLEHMSSESVDEDNLHISNAGSNGEFLSKQSGNAGGLTWAAAGGGFDPDAAVVFNDSQGNNDFRIESDGHANFFFVDASADKLMIGHSPDQTMTDSLVTLYNDDVNNGGYGFTSTQSNGAWGLIMNGQYNSSHDVGIIWRIQGDNAWFMVHNASSGRGNIYVYDGDQDDGMYMTQGANSWSGVSSDERKKTDWVNFDNALDKINTLSKIGLYKRIDPITGEYKDENVILTGLSAQEIEQILPDSIIKKRRDLERYPDDDTEYLSFPYQDVFVLALKAIQELSAKNDALEAENTALKTRMDTLEARVLALENT